MSKKTFETMNGLRGVAALAVVTWHGGAAWFGGLRLSGEYLAVDLFFVLSGFVIAHAYEKRLAAGMTIKEFLIVRMIRFYPLYILGTAISCITMFYSIAQSNEDYGRWTAYYLPLAIAMLPKPSSHISSLLYPLNYPAWSLFLEIIVNFIYAISYKFWSIRNIVVVMSVCAVIMLCTNWFPVTEGWVDGGATWEGFPLGLFRVFYSFPAGVLVYRALSSPQAYLPRVHPLALFLLLPILLAWNSGIPFELSMLVGIPLLVAFAARSEPDGILRSLCIVAGSASYAIYAIHAPLITLVRAAVADLGFDNQSKILGAVILTSILPICLLIDRWYDIPIRRRLNGMFAATRPLSDENSRAEANVPRAELVA